MDVGDDVAAVVTEREAALQALAGLPEADRELLTLIAWQGLSARQAAQVLGCTTATLTVRLYRARRRLESALEPSSVLDRAPVPVAVSRPERPSLAKTAKSAPTVPSRTPLIAKEH